MELTQRINADSCALIVIDMQNDYCHSDGICAKRGHSVEAAHAMIPRLKEIIAQARLVRIPVIFVMTENDETNVTPAWLNRYGVAKASSEYSCRTGSWGAQFYEVSPSAGDIVISKSRYSAFVGTELDSTLRNMGRSSLLFTGVATNICVESSLRDALSLDYYVTLVEDCCAAFTNEAHNGAIRNVKQQFGIVTTSFDIMDEWRNLSGQ